MFAYNINNMIKVKLTEHGKAILSQEESRIANVLKNLNFSDADNYSPYSEDEDGYIKFQMWDFMRIFGSHFDLGCPLIIENNEIIFPDAERR